MGRKSTKKLGLARCERLTRRADFAATYRERRSARDDQLVLCVRANGLPFSRIGLSISAKWGNAVRRNYFRRICREAFRLHKHELPTGYDIVIIPRAGIDLSLEQLSQSLLRLSLKLCQEKAQPEL